MHTKQDVGLYVGRFQPFHQGHLNRIRIATGDGYVSKVIPVLFYYTTNGEEEPGYDHFLTVEEGKQLFRKAGFEPAEFRVELARGYSKNLRGDYVRKRKKELLSLAGDKAVLITNSILEYVFGKLVSRLPMVYVPKFSGEKEIRGETIRKLLVEGKTREAADYLPPACRETFVEIASRKDMKKMLKERNKDTLKFGPFKVRKNR